MRKRCGDLLLKNIKILKCAKKQCWKDNAGRCSLLCINLQWQWLFLLGILILMTACPLHHQHWLNCYGHQQGTWPDPYTTDIATVISKEYNPLWAAWPDTNIGWICTVISKEYYTCCLFNNPQQPALSSLIGLRLLVIRKCHRLNYLLYDRAYDRAYVNLLEEDLPAEYEPELEMASLAAAADFSM